MKKSIYRGISILFIELTVCQPIKAMAYEYTFSSGVEKDSYGKSSSIDMEYLISVKPENVRRNKDVTYYPPEYGIFSGEIPTDLTSLYHTIPETNIYLSPTESIGSSSSVLINNSNSASSVSAMIPKADYDSIDSMLPSTSAVMALQTLPWEYADGSIGTLSISKIGLKVKVYEGETNESMSKGVGHFAYTSAWDGNVGFAGHNRGTNAYFGKIKNLESGDKITYTTRYGERTYQVYLKVKISNTDTSYLSWTDENILTLITCIANEPEYRLCIQAVEIK